MTNPDKGKLINSIVNAQNTLKKITLYLKDGLITRHRVEYLVISIWYLVVEAALRFV